MTAPETPLDTAALFAEFKAALPSWAHGLLDQRSTGYAHTALSNGWNPDELAEAATYHLAGLLNAADRCRDRLRRAAHPEVAAGG